MDSRSFWCVRLPGDQQQPPADGDLLAREDEDTHKVIGHYLHLADQLLATDTTETEEEEQDESSAA